MSNKEIFDFNPLAAIFLSGYATQLYILICYNKQLSNTVGIPTQLFNSSEKHIKRWNKLFLDFCMKQYESHILNHEKLLLLDTTIPTNPFILHS